MLRTYKTPAQWIEEVPGARLYILMSPEGKMVNWHCSNPPPEGKWSLLGIIE